MANPLYAQLAGGAMNPMEQMWAEFEKFKASFRGDPRQEVQRLLNSGQLTQAQYNQLAQQAQQMARMMGR